MINELHLILNTLLIALIYNWLFLKQQLKLAHAHGDLACLESYLVIS